MCQGAYGPPYLLQENTIKENNKDLSREQRGSSDLNSHTFIHGLFTLGGLWTLLG